VTGRRLFDGRFLSIRAKPRSLASVDHRTIQARLTFFFAKSRQNCERFSLPLRLNRGKELLRTGAGGTAETDKKNSNGEEKTKRDAACLPVLPSQDSVKRDEW
jgi:hypothetical protein